MATNSTHRVEVIEFPKMEKHENAERLSIVRIFNGYTCVVATDDWQGVQKCAYVPPDSLVPLDRPEFSFLAHEPYKHDTRFARIKAKRLRGVVSMGLLVPVPDPCQLGDDVAELFGVQHYEPPLAESGGDAAPPPSCYAPTYDLDTWRRYGHLLRPGERVIVTEKLHGSSGRWTFHDGVFHAGSRTEWKLDSAHGKRSIYWRVLHEHQELRRFLVAYPELIVYGEIYGYVMDLRYGAKKDELHYAVFDLWHKWEGRWLSQVECFLKIGKALERVPILFDGSYDPAFVEALQDGRTYAGTDSMQQREGVVIAPWEERWDEKVGRVKLKLVGAGYLEQS